MTDKKLLEEIDRKNKYREFIKRKCSKKGKQK